MHKKEMVVISDRKYIVYMHVFPNTKRYIGITSQSCKQRWGSNGNKYKGQLVYNAIKKYGWDNIEHLILHDNLTEEEAKAKEIELIAKYNTTNDQYGYNIHEGGGDAPRLNGSDNPTSRRVICINTGDIFDTVTQAADKYNTYPTTVTKACKGKRKTAGEMTWQYYDEYLVKPKNINAYKALGGRSRQVLCIETNTVYDSVHDAAKDIGVDYTSISKACSGKRNTAANMHWKYVS